MSSGPDGSATRDRQGSRAGGSRRSATAAAAAALLAAALAGCAGPDITADAVAGSVAPTFANLYVRQQVEKGAPALPAAALSSSATCHRTDPDQPLTGAGNDWLCTVRWLVAGPGTPVAANFDVDVRPDGCYDAQGPSLAVGQPTLVDAAGDTVVNPLSDFQSCFDID